MADISLDDYIGFTGTNTGRSISSRLGAKNVRGRGRGRGSQQVRSPQNTKFNVTGVGNVGGKSTGFDARQKLTSNAVPNIKVNVGDARQKIIQNTKFVDARVRIENKKAQGKPFDARNKISAKPVTVDARNKIKAKLGNASQTTQQTGSNLSQITVTQQGRVLTPQGGGVIAGSGGQLIKTIRAPNTSSGFMSNNGNGFQKTIKNSTNSTFSSQGRGQLIKTVRNNDVGGVIAGQIIRKTVQDNYSESPYRLQSGSSDLVITTTNRQSGNQQPGNIIHLNSKGGRLKPPPGASVSAMASERPAPMSAMSRLGVPQQRKPVATLAQRLKPAPAQRTGSQQLRLSMNTQSRLGSQPAVRASRPLSAQLVREAVTAPTIVQRQRSAPSHNISMSAAVAKDLEYYEQEYYDDERVTYEEEEEEIYASPPPRRVPPQPRLRPQQAPAPPEDAYVPTEDIVSPLQGYRIYITNLHPIVTQDDVVELFGSLGPLKKARLLKVGTAEVVYVHREDAVTAQRKYHLRELDGQPMEVRLMTRGPAPQQPPATKSAPPTRHSLPESPAEPMAGPLRLGGQSRLPSPPPQPRKPQSQLDKSSGAGEGIDPSLIHRALFKAHSKEEEMPHRPVSFVVKI